jgi:hypothetical protein
MKNIIYLILIVLIILGCSNRNEINPDITYNGSAVIQLTITNLTDTTSFYYKTSPILPYGCVIKKEEINHNGDYYFTYKTTMPDHIEFSIIKNFQTYLMPNDTLKIVANLDPSIDKEIAVQIDGVYGDISKYYFKKTETLEYWDLREPISNYSNPSVPLERAFSLSDSIFQNEKDFLIDYKKDHKLPEWFCNIIKMDIEYFRMLNRPTLISYRKFFFNQNVPNPETYYLSDNMPVYNPDAIFSKRYYDYLDIYFGLKHEDLNNKSGLERMVPLFERSIPEAQKELKEDILEYYFASRLSNLILSCRDLKELEKVDSVFISTKTTFQKKEIVEMLNAEKELIADFINTATSKNPFSFTNIMTRTKK